jgi:hypothetical protein
MATYKFELTEIEVSCGVTLEDVQRERPRALLLDGKCMVDIESPALAGAVARCAFGRAASFSGFNSLGYAVYRAA